MASIENIYLVKRKSYAPYAILLDAIPIGMSVSFFDNSCNALYMMSDAY